MQKYIIIVAGGKGERMQSKMPKQFVEVAGKPVLLHTFNAFTDYFGKAEFVLVLPGMEIGHWKHICYNFQFDLKYQLIEGGPTRFHSVKNGLSVVPNDALVAIHDAVRPFVSLQTLQNCFKMAAVHGSAIPVVPVTDTIRRVENGINVPEDRSKFRIVQTPQVFYSILLKKAYNRNYDPTFTDDASVFEAAGNQLRLVDGNAENIKITCPVDLGFARFLLTKEEN